MSTTDTDDERDAGEERPETCEPLTRRIEDPNDSGRHAYLGDIRVPGVCERIEELVPS